MRGQGGCAAFGVAVCSPDGATMCDAQPGPRELKALDGSVDAFGTAMRAALARVETS